MNIDTILKKIESLRVDIKSRHWPRLVAELETKSLRSLFLWALLCGFIVSVPWQCSRLIYNAYFANDRTVQLDKGVVLASPDQNIGSVTRMPNPRARRYVPAAVNSVRPAEGQAEVQSNPSQPENHSAPAQDQEAKIIHQEAPKYPIEALRNNESGTVQLRVSINAEGKPDQISIEHSSGSRDLDRAAKSAVSQWLFSPKIENGTAVNSDILIPIEFKAEQ